MKIELDRGRVCFIQFRVKHRRNGRHATYCIVRCGNPELEAMGRAYCHRRDSYNKVLGKAKALDRALAWFAARSFFCRGDRLRIWAWFYRQFQSTPDARVLSGFRCDAKVEA